ncbi:lactate utilization protein [bacterium]|nr:lactate utilization protein [bacterium]
MKHDTSWYYEARVKTTMIALKRRNMAAVFVPDEPAAVKTALQMITPGATVGLGGSLTVKQIGLLDALHSGKCILYDQYAKGISPEKSMQLRRKGLLADFFVTGTNAVTMDGRLVNLDGCGNRVAALTFGPPKVIVVVGRNKIVADVDEALGRIWNYAAPLNAKRLNRKVPCTVSGQCEDCFSAERICNHLVITERQMAEGRLTVIIVNQDLGF